MGLARGTVPFLQNQSWQNQALNALHYNTSQVGSVIPLIYGTARQAVNLIALGNFSGPSGAKGKQGTLPLTGTNTTRLGGKGGGGGKGASKKTGTGKKSQDFNIEVDFGMCHGPIQFPNNNLVWANAGVETFNAAQANFYDGSDGQAPDPVFLSRGDLAGYSGTCHITFTPMDLGSAPAIPNLAFELNGFLTGTGGPTFPVDANPGYVITDFLTNPRYGAGFPLDKMDDIDPNMGLNSYGDYCLAAQLAISCSLDGQQKAAEWLDGIAKLTNTAIVWSGDLLHFIPYGDLTLGANGALWTPNLIPAYSLTDHDFLPWHPHQDGAGPTPGDDDPVLVTRTNPADAINYLLIEYTERDNFYVPTMIPVFDQSAIDIYGLRTGENLPGKPFCNALSAQISAQIYLQRLLYVRNYYKFKLGWQFCRLEPMDIVLLTDIVAGLDQQAVRITSIEEDENGDLTIEAEEFSVGTPTPPIPPIPPECPGPFIDGRSFSGLSGAFGQRPGITSVTGSLVTSQAGDLIFARFISNSGQPGVLMTMTGPPMDSAGLTWSRRFPATIGTTDDAFGVEVWWAVSSGVFAGTITANFTPSLPVGPSAGGGSVGLDLFAVAGANLGSPFAMAPFIQNVGGPAFPSATYTTGVADALLLWITASAEGATAASANPGQPPWANFGSIAAGAPFATIYGNDQFWCGAAAQSGLVATGGGVNAPVITWGDAIAPA